MATEKEQLSARVATSAPVIVSLALLLVNDWYLKAAYGNWITGKLSDFAGIFLLALLAFAFLPRRKFAVAIGIYTAFAWWKSPLAQPLIELAHSAGLTRFNRVVDYSDLIALLVVPLAWQMVAYKQRKPYAPHALRRAIAFPMLLISACAMLATSYAAQHEGYEIRPSDPAASFDPAAIVVALNEAAESEGFRRIEHQSDEQVVVYISKWVELRYEIIDRAPVRISILERGGGTFGRKPEKVEQLRRRIVRALSEKFTGIEVVMSIPQQFILQRSSSDSGVVH